MTAPVPDPLSAAEVEALLQPDPRTRAADLLVLRDALQRMAEALERLSAAVQELGADPALPSPPAAAAPAPPPPDRPVELPRHPGIADDQ